MGETMIIKNQRVSPLAVECFGSSYFVNIINDLTRGLKSWQTFIRLDGSHLRITVYERIESRLASQLRAQLNDLPSDSQVTAIYTSSVGLFSRSSIPVLQWNWGKVRSVPQWSWGIELPSGEIILADRTFPWIGSNMPVIEG